MSLQVRLAPFWSRFGYDVTADGQRFLVEAAVGETAPPSVNILLNWTAALKR